MQLVWETSSVCSWICSPASIFLHALCCIFMWACGKMSETKLPFVSLLSNFIGVSLSVLQEINQIWVITRCPRRRFGEETPVPRTPPPTKTTRRRATAAPVSSLIWYHQIFVSTVPSRKQSYAATQDFPFLRLDLSFSSRDDSFILVLHIKAFLSCVSSFSVFIFVSFFLRTVLFFKLCKH